MTLNETLIEARASLASWYEDTDARGEEGLCNFICWQLEGQHGAKVRMHLHNQGAMTMGSYVRRILFGSEKAPNPSYEEPGGLVDSVTRAVRFMWLDAAIEATKGSDTLPPLPTKGQVRRLAGQSEGS